jgi:hypothetical protein
MCPINCAPETQKVPFGALSKQNGTPYCFPYMLDFKYVALNPSGFCSPF